MPFVLSVAASLRSRRMNGTAHRKSQRVYKPGFVPAKARGAIFIWDGSYLTPHATDPDDDPKRGPCAIPIWSCSRWGLPCRLCYQRRGALLPHHFTLTVSLGGMISVALSLRLPSPDVIRHRVLVEPGLSSMLP